MQDYRLATLVMDCPSARHTLKLVQFATTYIEGEKTIALVSVAGPQTAVKSFAAALNENVKLKCRLHDVGFKIAGDLSETPVSQYVDYVHAPGQGKYKIGWHRLPFNGVHCTARLKDESLLPALTDESLWCFLNGPRFTTPLLRSWMPYLRQALKDEGQLENLLEDLSNVGTIAHKLIEPASVSLEIASYLSAADLFDTFAYFLNPEQVVITEIEGGGVSEPSDEDGYGFFVEPDALPAAEEEAFGFFDEPGKAVDEDLGYGFFVEPEEIKAAAEEAQGYGFFVEPEDIKAKVEEEQGYGFFVEVAAPVSTPAVKPADPAPRKAPEKAPQPAAETSIRVSVEKVDEMINLVGELVITQSMLAETASHLDPVLHERLLNGLVQLERNTRELQESVMSVRMMPINFVFSRFPRLVRDLANKLDKKVQLKLVGEERKQTF